MTIMNTASSSHQWLGQFVVRFLQLNPGASVSSAIRRAVDNYEQAAQLGPDEVADMFYRRASHSDALGPRHVTRVAQRQAAVRRARLGKGAA
jgi:hypothetical protein